MADYNGTGLSIRKHADLMLSLAGKVLALVFAGLLGLPAIKWLTSNPQSNLAFDIYLVVLGIGSLLGISLMVWGLKRYAALERTNNNDHSASVTATTTEKMDCRDCLSVNKPMCILVERGATKISIRVE